jgi:hypothetical protein
VPAGKGGTEPTLKGCESVGSGPFAAVLKGCDPGCDPADCCAALTDTSSTAANIHFEVRMTLLSKFLNLICSNPNSRDRLPQLASHFQHHETNRLT